MTVEDTTEEEFDPSNINDGSVADHRERRISANNHHDDYGDDLPLKPMDDVQSQPGMNISNQNLTPCSLCGRKFLPDRLDKHLVICRKIKEKKRQLFDSVKQRAENLDKLNHCDIEIPMAEPPPPPPPSTSKAKTKKTKVNNKEFITESNSNNSTNSKIKSNWRQQHQEFIKTIRAARGVAINQDDDDGDDETGGSGTGAIPAGMVECPTCQRRFSMKAADRHIAWCAEAKNRRQQHQDPVQQSKNQEALERMKARTKYKPLPPGANKNNKESDHKQRSPRSRSTSTLSGSTIKSDSSVDSMLKPTNKTTNTATTISASNNNKSKKMATVPAGSRRTATRLISKSSENLATNKTTITNATNKKNITTGRTNDSKRNVVPRTKPVASNGRITSKIDTGLGGGGGGSGGDRNSGSKSRTEKSAPVMKFKEKFPHHNIGKSIIDQFQDIEQILRRNSTAIYDDSPKTVPGVRTGGMSPIKQPNRKEKSPMSRSETNLQLMTGSEMDIKQRIDQYISNLQTEWTGNSGGGGHPATVHPVRMVARENSAGSDEFRGSTSDSTDSGVGVIYASNGQMLETVRETTSTREETGKQSGASSKASARTFRAATIISPTLSDIEQPISGDDHHRRILLRNGSLNDIELLNGAMMMQPPPAGTAAAAIGENKPRFCHQCGTKYPSLAAKFCYECGSQRFNLVS